MRRESACSTQPELRPLPAAAFAQDGSPSKAGRPSRGKPGPGVPWRLLLALLAFGVSSCKGAPVVSHVLQGEKVWNEIEDMCSAIPAIDTLPQPSNALEEFCFMVLEFLQNDKLSRQWGFSRRWLAESLLKFHWSHTLCCHWCPNFMTGDRRDTKRMKNFKYLEEFKIDDTLCSDHVMEEDQLLSIKKDPNEDTEWNDVLRDFGILPPKEEVKDEIEEMVLRLQKEAEVKPYEKMNLKQLKEAEDDFDEEELKAVEMYRKQRLAELKALQKRQKFGELNEISGDQYVREVTNAPKDVWVVIHLYNTSIPMCALVNRHLSRLAIKFPETKFVRAVAKSCIENYHDNCLPTIFVYKDGKIEGKLIGVMEFGGTALTVEDLEWKLAEFGAVKTDLEENPRKGIRDMMMSSLRKTSIDDN